MESKADGQLREVDGVKVGFVTSDVYFKGFDSPSMYSTAKQTGADAVFLLAPGKSAADVSDDVIREMLALAKKEQP